MRPRVGETYKHTATGILCTVMSINFRSKRAVMRNEEQVNKGVKDPNYDTAIYALLTNYTRYYSELDFYKELEDL